MRLLHHTGCVHRLLHQAPYSHLLYVNMDICCLESFLDGKGSAQGKAIHRVRVNPPLWSDIILNTRSKDLKLQRVQCPLIKGLMALTKPDKNCKLHQVPDGFLLLAHANYEMNCLRKELIKPALNLQFHYFCQPLTEERARKEKEKLVPSRVYCSLFGTDLGKQVKDIQQ